jgi:hypothetical protein
MPEARVIPLDGGRGEGPAARRRKAAKSQAEPAEPVELPVEDPAESPNWERKLAGGLAFLRRRITGDYPVDEFGFDVDLTDHVALPLLRPMYEKYFRIEVRGMEHVPSEGGALIVTCGCSPPTWSSQHRSLRRWRAKPVRRWHATRTPSG